MEVSNIGLRLFDGVGEGPYYDYTRDELLVVNIRDRHVKGTHGRIYRKTLSCSSARFEECDLGENFTSFAIPTKSGKILVGLNQSVAELDWPREGISPSHTILATVDEGKPTRFNDAKCDPRGRLLAGTMSLDKDIGVVLQEGVASLYGLDFDRSVRVMDKDYSLLNGLEWTGDGTSMFFVDSVMRKMFICDYDAENFKISNKRVFFDTSEHSDLDGAFPDGCCIDSNDRLWMAFYFGSRVICVDTRTGQRVEEIKIPTKCVTSCCFAGPNLNELIVTTSSLGAPENDDEAGSLYRVTNINAKGVPMVRFGRSPTP